MGARLQARLGELTNRRTVPNILINGVSIGGGDEIANLRQTNTLIDKVNDLGAKKITQVEVKEAETIQHGLR
jgi:glutaredoxin-related protein